MPQDMYRSFRLACDRCRQHKLKCSQNKPSTVAQACQRCLRAKLQCTFSPRRRTGRPSEAKAIEATVVEDKSDQNRGENVQDIGIAAGSSSRVEAGHRDDTDFTESLHLSTKHARHLMGTAEITDPQWPQYTGFDQDSATPQIPGGTDLSTLELDSIVDYVNGIEWGDLPFQTSTTTNSTGLSIQDTNSAGISAAWNFEHGIGHCADTPNNGQTTFNPTSPLQIMDMEVPSPLQNNGNSGDRCTQMLTALARDLHKQLAVVTHNSWDSLDTMQTHHQGVLGAYPIGDILHLSHEFVHILDHMSLNTGLGCGSHHDMVDEQRFGTYPDGMEDRLSESPSVKELAGFGQDSSSPRSTFAVSDGAPVGGHGLHVASAYTNVDTPIALLILSSYVALIRILSLFCTYFHQSLSSPPTTDSSGPALQSLPGLKFGELLPSNEDYNRTHTAFKMLLGIIDHSENVLGLPRELRCVKYKSTASFDSSGSDTGSVSSSCSGANDERISCDKGENGSETSTELIGVGLVEAVLKQETLIGTANGGGGLKEVRKNVQRLKWTLRQKMDL